VTVSTWREPVQDAWIDYNGHLSEPYYVLVLGHATDAVMDAVGLGPDYRSANDASLYTVEAHIRYLDEVSAGTDLEVRSSIIGVTPKLLWIWHELWASDRLRATEQRVLARRAGDRQEVARVGREVVTECRQLAAERADVDVLRDVLVEPAVVEVHLRLAGRRRIPHDADASGKVLVQGEASGRITADDLLPFPAQAIIEGQIRQRLVAVLRVERRILRLGLRFERQVDLPADDELVGIDAQSDARTDFVVGRGLRRRLTHAREGQDRDGQGEKLHREPPW